jgi:GrpB-like predicted nucleotidyltransferase (UPF0157 family)
MTRRPVEIVDYDPKWPPLFEELRERLLQALRGVAVEIEHIGSTAVPVSPQSRSSTSTSSSCGPRTSRW